MFDRLIKGDEKSDIPFKGLEMPIVNGEVVPIVENPMDLRNVVENLLGNSSVWKKKTFYLG